MARPRSGVIRWKLVYPDRPEEPSATCHLQPETEASALCGHPWEALIMIPGDVERLELHPDMRCDGPGGCEERTGINPSDDPGGPYRFARTQPCLRASSGSEGGWMVIPISTTLTAELKKP
jgi:hypothetical protein